MAQKNSSLSDQFLIGEFAIKTERFNYQLDEFLSSEFQCLDEWQKRNGIYAFLLELIQQFPEPCFLLPAILDFVQAIHSTGVLQGTLHITHFEYWLNQLSELSFDERRKIKSKMVGKWLPRDEFQCFFPIGMEKHYFGTHFVCAHPSPDTDTIVASFVGWLDAFAAQVTEGMHVWNIPGGQGPKQITRILEEFFGSGVVAFLAQSASSLEARAMDLMNPLLKTDTVKDLEKVNIRTDYEEISSLLETYSKILVVYNDKQGGAIPIGIIPRSRLHKSLGTVSLRDFSSREESKIAAYLDIISVIDHHRCSLKTALPPVCLIADVQSSNVLIAEQAFAIEERYSNDTTFYIHPVRQFIDYFCYLIAILDDTDLLTKVSARDVHCVARILNHLKSLTVQSDQQIISLDNIPKDKNFAKQAAASLLRHEELYSIYKKVYLLKEQEIEENIRSCLQEQDGIFFSDTKSQGSCARVGQTKLFANNFEFFDESRRSLIQHWVQQCQSFHNAYSECDLFIHMISTVAGADEMYQGLERNYEHQDEIWFWIAPGKEAVDHLDHFLRGFRSNPELVGNPLEVEFLGNQAHPIRDALMEHLNFYILDLDLKEVGVPVAVIKFKAGTINSRKASIAPFVPYYS